MAPPTVLVADHLCGSQAWDHLPLAALSPAMSPGRPTVRTAPSGRSHSSLCSKIPAPMSMFASRRPRGSSWTAEPTSSSRPRIPAAMTSSPTSCRARPLIRLIPRGAAGRVLYGVHNGGIPGTNHPTNQGVDPYVATRRGDGLETQYVGVPANNPFSVAPFSSIPSGASANLETFSFGGPEGCSPCFAGGYTGIPVHLPDGRLVQGMVAAPGLEPGPAATPDGHIAKDLSANGEHFIFGSTSLFAEGGNDATGDVSIYDHNLISGATHVVSNTPDAKTSPIRCPACRAKAAVTPRAMATGSPSSTSQATAPTSSSARRSQPTPTATSTGTSTWTSTTGSARSTSPPGNQRRPL